MLFQHGPLIAIQQGYRHTNLSPSGVTAISAHGAHVFGALAITLSAALVVLYFYLRFTSPRVVEHGSDRI
jgi:hypothetical protein